MSQNQQTPASQKPQSDDPLASLHRMSTTAGVASQDYVAINLPSVAALLLGLASGTVLMSNVMVVVPILAIVVGIIALRQVGNSNGTQTGRPMAVVGMLLAVGVVAVVGVREFRASQAVGAEQGKVFAAVDEFGSKLMAKDYTGATNYFTPTFFTKKQLSQQEVVARWQALLNTPQYGDLTKVETNGRVNLSGDASTVGRYAETMIVFRFSKAPNPLRRAATLRKNEAGEWRLDDMPDMFPSPVDPSASAPPSPSSVMPR